MEGNEGYMEGQGETEGQGGNEVEREVNDGEYQGDADDIEGADE